MDSWPHSTGPRGQSAARAIRDHLLELGIKTRAGLHTGECELVGDDVGGIAVHIGARVMSSADAGEILVSSTVKDLVTGSGLAFDARGTHTLKGAPGEWALFAVHEDAVHDRDQPTADFAPIRPELSDRLARALARRAPSLARVGIRALRS